MRSSLVSLLTIITLCIPTTAIVSISLLICLLDICSSALDKIFGLVQFELELFDELHVCEDNEAIVWDKHGLFIAFIKGEDVQDLRQKKKYLKPKETMKRPIDATQFCLENRCAGRQSLKSFLVHTDFSDQSSSSSGVAFFPRQALGLIGVKYRDKETKRVSFRKERKYQNQVRAEIRTEVNFKYGETVLSFRKPMLPQHSSGKKGNLNRDKWRPILKRDEKKKRNKAWIVVSFQQAKVEKKGTFQETDWSVSSRNNNERPRSTDSINASSSLFRNETLEGDKGLNAKKEKKSEAVNDICYTRVNVDKNVTRPQCCAVRRGKKRSNAANQSYSISRIKAKKRRKEQNTVTQSNEKNKRRNEGRASCFNSPLTTPDPSAKKRREEYFTAVQQRRQISLASRHRNVSQNSCSKPRQRKVKESIKAKLRRAIHWAVNDSVVTIEQSEAKNQTPAVIENAPGELKNTKRPLPVAPLTGQPIANETGTSQVSLPTSPSVTELVSLLERLHIKDSVDPAVSDALDDDKVAGCDDDNDANVNCNGDFSYGNNDDDVEHDSCGNVEYDVDSDAEYEVFPELLSLPQQVFKIIEALV